MGLSGEFETSKCGNLTVINDGGWNKVLVRFNNTGFEKVVRRDSVKAGNVFDPMHRGVYGVGFVGVGKYRAKNGNEITKVYDVWRGMMRRCYSEEWHNRKPSYSDCYVCPEWHDFQVFAEWFECNYIDGFHLDKDKLSNCEKVYSPETCCFISLSENNQLAHAGKYSLKSPGGRIIEVVNMSEFCRNNNLNRECMAAMARGDLESYLGWRIA